VVLGIAQGSWIIEVYRKKSTRKLVLKNWFNSTVWTLGFLAFITVLLTVFTSLGMLNTLVRWKTFYTSFDWITIESVVGANVIAPYLILALLFLFVAILLWVCKSTYSDIALWKYTPEEIEYKKKLKKESKEKAQKRLSPKIFKMIYPEKKRGPFKYPRVAKFLLMDIGREKE
jgi:predicted RND superfamily exporter protein